MANATDIKILEEGPRNAMVRITGVLDTSNATMAAAITTAMFTNNDLNATPLKGFRLDHIWFSVAQNMSVVLTWDATTPQLIGAWSDANEMNFRHAGGLQPDMAAAGYTGSISLATVNWATGTLTFTVMLDLVKIYAK
jgi:hypothetical protein